jgi:polar amino acid transport system substrate-binding protein
MTRQIVAAVAACLALVALSACDSGSSKAAPKTTNTTPSTTAAPAPNCGDPKASYAPLPGNPATGPTIDRIRQRGRLIAGVSSDTLLFGFRNPQSGKLEGFDIDVVKRISREIFGDDRDVTYRVMTYAQRIPALNDPKNPVDVVADVMTMNCKRWVGDKDNKGIAFSSQYFNAGQKVLVRKNANVAGIDQLNGKKVCVAKGSTNYDELKDHYPKVVAVPVDDISDCMVLFQQGAVDAVTGDDTVLIGFTKQDPYAKVVGAPITSEPYGLGMNKSDTDFVRYVNGILDQTRTDGTWKQWYRTWLGGDANPPPAVYGRT